MPIQWCSLHEYAHAALSPQAPSACFQLFARFVLLATLRSFLCISTCFEPFPFRIPPYTPADGFSHAASTDLSVRRAKNQTPFPPANRLPGLSPAAGYRRHFHSRPARRGFGRFHEFFDRLLR